MSTSVSTLHPIYEQQMENWSLIRDAVEGELAIRRDITRYLPVPPGIAATPEYLINVKLGSDGRYGFYASFAEFPEIVSPTLSGILGLIHEKPPVINIPTQMQHLIDAATPDGESIYELWERITKEILITGRIILLMDIYEDELKFCPYTTESMINWKQQMKRDGGAFRLIVLKEHFFTDTADDEFAIAEQVYYRVLRVVDGLYTVEVYQIKDGEQVIVPNEENGDLFTIPMLFGRSFSEIPITIINAMDTGVEYGPIPLLPMAKRSVSIFRKSADYHRALYMKGDPQVVITGVQEGEAPTTIGGGAVWVFENSDAKADYLDIDGQGIPLMRFAINDEFQRFADEVGMLFEGVTSGYESGEALRRRQAMRQVTIKSLVINAAAGFELALKNMARLMGIREIDSISVIPNLEFTEAPMIGQELREFVTAKKMGAPISNESLHALMKKRQLTTMSYDEEVAALMSETEFGEIALEQEQASQPTDQGTTS